MQSTIEWLGKSNQLDEIDKLMGVGLPWEQKETEEGTKYYKLNYGTIRN